MRRVIACVLGVLAGCDTEPPVVHDLLPMEGEDLRGVRETDLWVAYSDASDVAVRWYIDDEPLGRPPQRMCDDEGNCEAQVPWDTTSWPPGDHTIRAVLEDEAGNQSSASTSVFLDDVLTIPRIRLANINDGVGSLEIEVYVYTANRELVGCAGDRHGLDDVAFAGTTYSPNAFFINPDLLALGTLDMPAGPFTVEVIEDDDPAVCPTIPAVPGNDLVASLTWDGKPGMLTGTNVELLELGWERTATAPLGIDPEEDDPFNFGGNSGCSTGGADGGWVLVLLALGLVTSRASRAAPSTSCTRRPRRLPRSPS